VPRVPRPGFRNRRRLLVQLAAKDPAGKPRGLNHQAQTLGKSGSHNKTCLYHHAQRPSTARKSTVFLVKVSTVSCE